MERCYSENFRRWCHVDTMLYATGLLSLPVLLRKRKLPFMSSPLGSKNGVVAYVSSMLYGSLRSSFFVMPRMGVTLLCISHNSFVKTYYSSRCLELLCVLDVGSKMFCCGFGPSMAFEIFLYGENCSFNRLVLIRLTLTHFKIIF